MASLVITKGSIGEFSFVLDGDVANQIKNIRNDLTTVGIESHFKTSNGANLIKDQQISPTEVTIIDGGTTLNPANVEQLFAMLDSVGYFDWINGFGGGGGTGVDRFDELLDTPDYFGNNGKTLVIDESQLKLIAVNFYNYNLFTQLNDTPDVSVPNKFLSTDVSGNIIWSDLPPPATDASKLDSGGYPGTGQDLADAIDNLQDEIDSIPSNGINEPSIVYVEINGSDETAEVGNSRKPFLTIDTALDALQSTGGVIKIGVGTFISPNQNKIKSNVKFIGSGKPVTDSVITYSGLGVQPNITSPTKLVGGTILNGIFQCIQKSGVEIHNLGIDSGLDWCNSAFAGVSQEGLVFAQFYNTLGGLPSEDGFHQLQSNYPPTPGIVVNNVSVLCKSATSLNHAMLIENTINAKITNISTYYGIHGLVIKSIGATVDGHDGHGHGENGLILKSNDYAYGMSNKITNVYLTSIVGYDGAGLRFVSEQSSYPVAFNSVENIAIEYCKYGLKNDFNCDGNSVTNLTLYKTQGIGIDFDKYFTNAFLSNIDQRAGTTGYNIVQDNTVANTSVLMDNCKASDNSGTGFILTATNKSRIKITNSFHDGSPTAYVLTGNIYGEISTEFPKTGTFKYENSSANDFFSSIDVNGKINKSLVKVGTTGNTEFPATVLGKGSGVGFELDNPTTGSVAGWNNKISGVNYWIQGIGVGGGTSEDYNIYNYGGGGSLGVSGTAIKIKKLNNNVVIGGTATASPATVGTELVTLNQLNAAARPYKSYTAVLTQSGTSAPTIVNLMENGLSGAITWAYTSVGTYTGTLTGAFTVGKTVLFLSPNTASLNPAGIVGGSASNINTVQINTKNMSGTLTDSILVGTAIEIRVYP